MEKDIEMNKEKSTSISISDEIDYSGRPFDFRGEIKETALICELDPIIRQKISEALKSLEYNIIEPTTYKDAIKYFSFHTFNVVVVNENFENYTNGVNTVLIYLEKMSMSIRRKIFVVLVSATFATMDYMHTLNKSVNLIINEDEIAELPLILKKEIEENEYFYHVYKEYNRKYGKI